MALAAGAVLAGVVLAVLAAEVAVVGGSAAVAAASRPAAVESTEIRSRSHRTSPCDARGHTNALNVAHAHCFMKSCGYERTSLKAAGLTGMGKSR